jgi:hypothetical protein
VLAMYIRPSITRVVAIRYNKHHGNFYMRFKTTVNKSFFICRQIWLLVDGCWTFSKDHHYHAVTSMDDPICLEVVDLVKTIVKGIYLLT